MDVMENPVGKAAAARPPAPAHEQVYQRLRAQILFGEMAPGQAVTIQGLTAALGVGMTPVREAIRRLISDGALVFQGNRRVCVPVLSAADVQELAYLRQAIETKMAFRATSRIAPQVVRDLAAIDDALDAAILNGDVAGYLHQNYRFHSTLYSHADAPIMAELTDRLWLRFGPSLRVVCGRFGTQNLPDRHKDVLAALRMQDAEGAARAIGFDVEQGMNQIGAMLSG